MNPSDEENHPKPDMTAFSNQMTISRSLVDTRQITWCLPLPLLLFLLLLFLLLLLHITLIEFDFHVQLRWETDSVTVPFRMVQGAPLPE